MAYRLFHCSLQLFLSKTNNTTCIFHNWTACADNTQLCVKSELHHGRTCPRGNAVLFAEAATPVPFCEPSEAQNGRKGARGARRKAAIFRASGDHYATVWAQQVWHADGGALRGGEGSGGWGRHRARAIFKAAIRVSGKVGTDAASFYAQADMEGWGKKKPSVDDGECWIFEKRRCDEGDGLSAMKHFACKRRCACFYSAQCRSNPAASFLLRTVGCVQTIKRLSLGCPECHTWTLRFGDDWVRQHGITGYSPSRPSFS